MSGLEGAWSANPIAWTTQYLDNLLGYEWEQTRNFVKAWAKVMELDRA